MDRLRYWKVLWSCYFVLFSVKYRYIVFLSCQCFNNGVLLIKNISCILLNITDQCFLSVHFVCDMNSSSSAFTLYSECFAYYCIFISCHLGPVIPILPISCILKGSHIYPLCGIPMLSILRPKKNTFSFNFFSWDRRVSEFVFFSFFFFYFSDRLIFRREEAPSSDLCILIICWSAQLIWKLNLAWG
jgi:hypothetical protein